MKTIYQTLISFILIFISIPLLAHDAHGDPQWYGSIMHYLSEPAHISMIIATIVVIPFFWKCLRFLITQSRHYKILYLKKLER